MRRLAENEFARMKYDGFKVLEMFKREQFSLYVITLKEYVAVYHSLLARNDWWSFFIPFKTTILMELKEESK